MAVHKIPAIPGKFKESKEPAERKQSVAERIQEMKARREAAKQIGTKRRG